jgi:hypothetical protein
MTQDHSQNTKLWGHRLFWDYYGPMAQGTANHFLIHLKDFLVKNEMSFKTGVEHSQVNHSYVFCETPIEAVEILIKSLRPKRYQLIEI